MRDITIGQYYPKNSIIHRLDPRVKLFGTMVFIICLFMISSIPGYVVITAFLALSIILSKIPFKKLLKGLRGVMFIVLFSAILNVFFIKEGKSVVDIGAIEITTGGIIKGIYMTVRIIYLVLGSSIMTLTTKPNDMADGLEKSFSFLKKIKFPVHEIAMMISLALRFIPTLMEETDKIIKAQKARGADFETGNIFKKVKNYIPLLIPLFVSSIYRALEIATAMEARCYNGGNRTKLKPLMYERRDYLAYISFAIFVVAIVLVECLVVRIGVLNVLILG